MRSLEARGWRLEGAAVWVALLFSIFCFPLSARGQSDPLNAAYKPSVDCNAADYPSNVSLTNALAKLRQTADSPTSITDYGSTPLPCLTVYGTQNQFVSFQANVQAPAGGYAALTVTMSAMSKTTGPGGNFTIPAPSTSDTDIVVYREAYVSIPTVEQTGRAWFGATGSYPDPLVPAIDPYWHQVTGAFPVAVTAGNNQSAWVDVYIPQAAPSGWYSGTVTLSNSGTTIAALPVLIAVAQWPASDGGYMPSTPTLPTLEFTGFQDICRNGMGYSPSALGNCTAYPGGGDASVSDLAVQLLDNRLSLAGVAYAQSDGKTITSTIADMLNGVATDRIQRIMPGSKLGPVEFNDGALNATDTPTWVNTFVSNGWFSTNQTFDYLCDEPPNGCAWSSIQTRGSASRGYSTPNLPLLVTTDLQDATSNNVLNDIDWMVTPLVSMEPEGGTDQRPNYDSWLAGNCCSGTGPTRRSWAYLSCDPNCGSVGSNAGNFPEYAVDNFGPVNEAMEWMTFRKNEYGELYYGMTICWEGVNGCPNPWTSVRSDDVYGDGTLFYPGTNSTNCPGCGGAFVNVSTPIFMPSIRLKLMRDGIQDYEYLHLLTALGGTHATAVTNAINSWIVDGYCFNVVATSGATATDHTHSCPASGTQTFTGDLHDAYVSLVQDMQTATYAAGRGPLPVLPPHNLDVIVH